MFLEIIVASHEIQVNLEVCHQNLKGVFIFLDASHLLEVPLVLFAAQLIFHEQTIYLLVLNPND
jgi:hypothetical protein